MAFFKNLIVLNKQAESPLFLQITNGIISLVRRGIIKSGTKLPGSRELALELKVHRKTILASLDELAAQGWITMLPRKGTFVADHLPDVKPLRLKAEEQQGYPSKTLFSIEEFVDLSFPVPDFTTQKNLVINDGFPDLRFAPVELFMREIRSLAKQKSFRKYLSYGSPNGPSYLLETLSDFLRETRALAITPENAIVTKGAQMGIYLASKIILKPGDEVIVSEPNYFAANATFIHFGGKLNRVPVDSFGMDVDAVERICKKKKIRLLYVIPHHHHPTTVTLSPERRIRLLELAAQYKFAIIEDDYDYDFHYQSTPVLPMASLDHHGNVIYIGTLTKTLAPAIRVGFMIGPQNFISVASRLRRFIDRQGDSIMEAGIAALYRNGTMSRHIKKVVKVYHERRDHFCSLLKEVLGDEVTYRIPDGGMSVWTTFKSTNIKTISERAAAKGLTMSTGKIYNTHNTDYNATRLGFASLNSKEQDKVIEIISKCL